MNPNKHKEMLYDLNEADNLIVKTYFKLKQEGNEKAASLLLFDASIKIQDAINLLEKD
jgi:hypothetical protein